MATEFEPEGLIRHLLSFCSRSDLIEMKRAAGRLIDLADLERLAES